MEGWENGFKPINAIRNRNQMVRVRCMKTRLEMHWDRKLGMIVGLRVSVWYAMIFVIKPTERNRMKQQQNVNDVVWMWCMCPRSMFELQLFRMVIWCKGL